MKNKTQKISALIFVVLLAAGSFYLIRWFFGVSKVEQSFIGNEMENGAVEKGFVSDLPKDVEIVMVDRPKANETIKSPVKISGEARGGMFFEGTFPVKLLDQDGKVLAKGTAKATKDWMTSEFVPFELELGFDVGNSSEGMLVFENDNPSGLPEKAYSYSLPVFFSIGTETTVKVFFGNSTFDPGQKNCWVVYAVGRKVPKVSRIGQMAIEELLKGPTEEEKAKGYFTSIQEGTQLNGLSIQHGVAFADFNETLDHGIGGSCRVMSIRSQIEQTLKQFPTVKEVQIYVGDRSEDVLQP